MSKVLKNIIKIIINILTFIIFAALIVVIYCKLNMLVKGKNYFEIFGYSVFNVATGSMEPTLSQNDVIIVKEADNYKLKDIITYEKDGDYITHRIIDKNKSGFVTKGDANNSSDGNITEKQVIGKVIKIYYDAGIWQKILTRPSIIAMIFITLILFDFAFSYKGYDKKITKKKVVSIENVDIKKVQEQSELPKMSDKEIKELYKKFEAIKKDEDIKLEKKEKELIDYTIRLDLNKLQKEIDNKLKEE